MENNYSFSKIIQFFKKLKTIDFLLVLIFISLPLKNIFISIATIMFVSWCFFFGKKEINAEKIYYLPIAFFVLMITSLSWSYNFNSTLFGIKKQLSFLFIPLAFLIIPKRKTEDLHIIFRTFSFGMVVCALFCLGKALISYMRTNDINHFFYKNLVPSDPGVIYMSVFASFALFYFIQIKNKCNVEKIGLTIVIIFTFLLSSKSIITIDFIIIICYYTFFVTIPSGTKAITIISVSVFLIFSVLYVKKVRERFLIEYETAFIDNTLNYDLTKDNQSVYNVSISEAWNKKDFHQNSYLPGTALRIYQIRVFLEILFEQKMFFSGFGLEASQDFIRGKAKEHNLLPLYGEYNFHNQYLQTYADLGVLGILIILSMLYINFWNALHGKNFMHLAFSITTIVLFLSESFFCRQRGIVFFIVLYCLFNGTTSKESHGIKST